MSEQSVEWHITQGKQVPYEQALTVMEARVDAIIAGKAPELIWLLEHPPLYTAGTSAKAQDLINPQFPVYTTGRGGQYTYHGPGQRVVYVMLNLRRCMQGKPDLRRFVWMLEEWVIQTLAEFDVHGQRREGRVGIWVNSLLNGATASNATPDLREEKIAAIGIRLRQWVSFHGIAINVNPDLSHYAGIVPCGIREHGVTSLHALGRQVTLDALDIALKRHFPWD